MRITFVTRKFGNVERNSHCDVLHITPIRVARLFLDCNGDFAIKAYGEESLIIFKEEPKWNFVRLCMCYYYISLHNNREIYVQNASTS